VLGDCGAKPIPAGSQKRDQAEFLGGSKF